ncbi:hypothetical protein MMC06_002271 [Schaereria dolodes]|nr:hypothetical protein [Schaereria dolodes]
MHFSTLLSCASLLHLGIAGYTVKDDYFKDDFFSMFNFFVGPDPTDGFVNYLDHDDANSAGLFKMTNGAAYMGVDSTNTLTDSSPGRNSIRLASNIAYDKGLIVIDLAHMPGGVCGTWPAFWMVGPNWPSSGEIDIIEGVNSGAYNGMTLHTSSGCTVQNNPSVFTGSKLSTPNCDVNAPGQGQNVGCSFTSQNTQSYGTGFNANNGGVYATEWTDSQINIWFFPRGSIPSDLSGDAGTPNPSGWPTPVASFQGCNVDQYFNNQNIIFDTTFCGSWAGDPGVWGNDPVCSKQADTCKHFVENNPSAFQDAYWMVNSLRVYTSDGSTSEDEVSPASSASAAPIVSSVAAASSTSTIAAAASPTSTVAAAAPSSSSSSTTALTSSPLTTTFVSPPVETSTSAPAVVTVTDALDWNEFGAGSSGIPEGSERKKRSRRHLARHVHAMNGHS